MAVPAVDQKAIRDASLRETLRWLRSGDMQYDRVAAWMRGNIDVILAAAAFDWEGTLRSASRDSGIAGNAGLYASLAKHTQGHCLKYASEALRDDDDLVKRCLCLDGDTLEHASARLRDDAAMVCLALRTSGQALRYASEQLRGDVGIALKAVTSDWRSLRYTGPDLRDDAVVVRTAVHLHGEALQYASPRCRGDREIVLAAVRNCGTALRHATDAIYHTGDRTRLLEVALTQDDETTCDSDTGVQPLSMFRATIDAPRESPLISRRRASSRPCIGMKRAKELVGEAVRQDGMALQYVHPELRKNSFLGALAVQQTPLALACVGREVRNTRQVVLGAVRRCGAMLQHASEKLRADRDIVSVAVARDGTALGFASFELRSDAAIVGIAVRHTHTALAHATGRLRASKPFILSLVSQNPHCLQYADTSLQSDSTVLAACGAQLQCSLPQAVTQADDVPVHPVPPLRRSHGVVSLLEVAQPPEHLQKRLRRSQGQQSLPRMESAWGA